MWRKHSSAGYFGCYLQLHPHLYRMDAFGKLNKQMVGTGKKRENRKYGRASKPTTPLLSDVLPLSGLCFLKAPWPSQIVPPAGGGGGIKCSDTWTCGEHSHANHYILALLSHWKFAFLQAKGMGSDGGIKKMSWLGKLWSLLCKITVTVVVMITVTVYHVLLRCALYVWCFVILVYNILSWAVFIAQVRNRRFRKVLELVETGTYWLKKIFFLICMCLCEFMCTACMKHPWRPEGLKFPGSVVIDSCELGNQALQEQ